MRGKAFGLVVLFCSAMTVAMRGLASGFALYEPTTVAHAMGGALVGRAMDASANYINPATLSDLTNIQVTVGFVTEHPRGAVSVRRNGGVWAENPMDPGLFWLPHLQLAAPLPFGFTFGLGMDAEYGLGTCYPDSWPMNWNTTETTVQGFVINPNLAYEITDDWSVGAGLRWLYFDFEQYSSPLAAYNGYELGRLGNHLRGDNGFRDMGWQIGTRYRILDNLSVGAVYKSAIDVGVEGTSSMVVKQCVPAYSKVVAASAASYNGDADASLRLPQSISAGANWDITPTWHLGGAVSWTEWSQFKTLVFHLNGNDSPKQLNWRDTWRASLGLAWDFWQDWRWMISYTWDMDSTRDTQSSTMLPPANRHIAATGFSWNCWRGLELAISYSCIFMEGGDMHTTDSLGNSYDLETCWGYCHAAGFSVTYRF